jgi:hypothetical protein
MGGGEAHTRQMTLVSAKEEAEGEGEGEDTAAAGSETTTSLSIAARAVPPLVRFSLDLSRRRAGGVRFWGGVALLLPGVPRAGSFLDCSAATKGGPCAGRAYLDFDLNANGPSGLLLLWTMRNSLARRLTRRRRHTLPLGPLEKRKKNSARPAPPRRTATTRQGTYGLARDRCSSASCVHLGKYSVLLHHCSLRVVQKLHCPLLIHQVCPAFAVSWEILVTY